MNYYDVTVSYDFSAEEELDEEEQDEEKVSLPVLFDDILINKINKDLGLACGYGPRLAVFAYAADPCELSFAVAVKVPDLSKKTAFEVIEEYLQDTFNSCSAEVDTAKEITVSSFLDLLKDADDADYLSANPLNKLEQRLKVDFFCNAYFDVDERLCSQSFLEEFVAQQAVKNLLLGNDFLQEIKRIYSIENTKEFNGIPVQYEITADNASCAQSMADVLVQALYSNHRLLSRRMSRIYNISKGCYDEQDLENVFKNAQGATIVLELQTEDGVPANEYRREARYITDIIRKFQRNVLIILVQINGKTDFTNKAKSILKEAIDVVELGEGKGNRKQAIAYFNHLITTRKIGAPSEEYCEKVFSTRETFSPSQVWAIYTQWQRDILKENFYQSYKDWQVVKDKGGQDSVRAYEKLQRMIGLTKVKSLLDQIIANFIMKKRKNELGISTEQNSLHMLFTGNPGTAKTTVARLLAEILREKGILSSGTFVECGRGDLVGRYVGWTAQTVQEKFQAAKGGILFIDEAYSLVDEHHSYGEEAINTIVQEMENNRTDTMVIFAGYPEKMKNFLAQNEGLRSRIAFHLDFPDYTVEELQDIFQLIATEQQYILSPEVLAQSREILAEACHQPDFGNGRFVRTLFEQVQMQQALRLTKQFTETSIPREALLTLQTADFAFAVNKLPKKPARQQAEIGFKV